MKVTVIDYGMGNLFSVQRAVEICGIQNINVSTEPSDLASSDRVILPGVGAFGDGMAGLSDAGFIEPLKDYASTGRPLLGICLGMQMLADTSEEFGAADGLGLISARVVPIPRETPDGTMRKSPFIGWTNLSTPSIAKYKNSCLNRLRNSESVYLVHSFHTQVDNPDDLLATYDYDGYEVTAAIKKDNVTGLQFHPEKSADAGLKIMSDFLNVTHG